MYHAHLDLADRHPSTPPPSYTPSLHSVPSYAVEPSEDEESLDTGARPQTPIPCGEFTAKAGDVTVSLHEQEFGAGIPTYRQNAIVKGHVEISNRTAVVSVSMKLEGRQKWAIADVGRCERLLFSETHELWTKPTPLRDNLVAPNILDFYVPFPFKFVDKMYANPLVVPPSFGVKFHEDPGVSVQNEFTLITVMTVARPGSRSKQDSFTLPILLNYRPRSRPYLPIPYDLLPFFSTSKTMPEQWYQICSSIPCKDGTQKPMDCHLFIPHTQIYALRDTIPFHLHLRGSAESLRLFLGKTIKRAASSSQSDAFNPPSPSSPTIRVYIRRQVSVVVKGIRAYQGLVIGEGKLKAVERPPEWSPVSSSEEQHRTSLSESVCDYSLDWEGEVKCNDDVLEPSFVSGDIHVKDFVVVHLRPADLRTAAHVEHRHSHAIRLVTDKYREVHPSEG